MTNSNGFFNNATAEFIMADGNNSCFYVDNFGSYVHAGAVAVVIGGDSLVVYGVKDPGVSPDWNELCGIS